MKALHRTTTAAALALLTATAFAQTRAFTSQYTFGDSLSDSGNVFALSNRTQPGAPYFTGRFSNGPVFTELLGNALVPAVTVSSVGPNRNFAFGGATARDGGAVPSFARQIGAYRLQGAPAQPTDLFTVLFGANDLFAVLSAPSTPSNPAALDAAGAAAAQAVASGVQSLIGLGAKIVVVAGLPNLGATPAFLALGGPGGAGTAFGLRATNAFNRELLGRLAPIAAAAPDVNLVYVDLQGVLDRVIAEPAALGFANATQSFLLTRPGSTTTDPDTFVFFDEVHPSARMHALVASIVTEQLNPEIPLGFAGTLGTAALALQSFAARAVDHRTSQIAVSTRPAGRADAYAMFNYGDGSRARERHRPKFEFDAQVVTAGADLQMGSGAFFGGAVNVGRLEAEVSSGRGGYKIEDAAGRVYAGWRGGPVTLILDGDYGVLTLKNIRRTTGFGGLPTRGRAGGDHWGVGGKVLWNVDVGAASVRPWLGLRTHRVKIDEFSEKDLPALAMDFALQEAESTRGSAGVDVATNWRLAGRSARFDLRGAWHGEIGSDERRVTGRLANNFTRPTSLLTDDGDGEGFELGGAVTIFFAKNWSASLGYSADVRTNERVANRGTFSVQTGF